MTQQNENIPSGNCYNLIKMSTSYKKQNFIAQKKH